MPNRFSFAGAIAALSLAPAAALSAAVPQPPAALPPTAEAVALEFPLQPAPPIPPAAPSVPLELSLLSINGQPVEGFAPERADYSIELPAGSSIPTVSANAASPLVSVAVAPTASLPGTTQIIATYGTNSREVRITFTLAPAPQPVVEAPRSSGGGGGGSKSKSKSERAHSGASESKKENHAPRDVSVLINGGATTTSSRTVSLTLAASDTGPLYVQVSGKRTFRNARWSKFAQNKRYELPEGAGIHTVYVRFKDAERNVSATVSDTIVRAAGPARTYALQRQMAPAPQQAVAGTHTLRFPRDLALGASGSDVRALQIELALRGFYKGQITSYFGAQTQAAVARYQAHYGLPAAGIAGPMTRAHLSAQ